MISLRVFEQVGKSTSLSLSGLKGYIKQFTYKGILVELTTIRN